MSDAQRAYLEGRREVLDELFAETYHTSSFDKLVAIRMHDDPARAAEAEELLRRANEIAELCRRYGPALQSISAELYGNEPL